MDAEYSRKSGQIPAFGDWENANELPITQYFECARQAGLLRCSCSGDCGGSFANNAAAWGGAAAADGGYGVSYEKPVTRRVYAVHQRKSSGINKGFSHSKDQPKQFRVEDLIDRPSNRPVAQRNHRKKQSWNSENLDAKKSSFNVKSVDEDLYKVSPELVKNSKRSKIMRFLFRCMAPSCAA